MRRVRVGWITAVALGVLAGIYMASCGTDNEPEAGSASFARTAVVRQFTTRETSRLVNFRLCFEDGSEATVTLKLTTPLAQFLRAHNTQRAALALEVQ